MHFSDRVRRCAYARGSGTGAPHSRRRDIPFRYSGTVAIVVLLQFMMVTAEAKRRMAQTPFAGLTEIRFGNGAASQSGSSRERVRCRSTHPVGDGTVSRLPC
jgi:hypothetical protein